MNKCCEHLGPPAERFSIPMKDASGNDIIYSCGRRAFEKLRATLEKHGVKDTRNVRLIVNGSK